MPVDEGNQHGRRIGYIAVPNLPIVYKVFAHHDCVHNQLVAINNRVCGKTYAPDPTLIKKLHAWSVALGRTLPKVAPWSLDQVVNNYTGAKRKRYAEAADAYRRDGISHKDAAVKMFIKCEKIKYNGDDETKRNPDPRAIQFRDPKYSVVFAQYLKPCEHLIYRLRGNRRNKLPPFRLIGKGLNQRKRAVLLRKKLGRFVDPVVLSLDMSRFDQHVNVGLLRAEHALYMQMCADPEFELMLSWQINNKVRTSRNITYKTVGKRMSGDMNTALGNCVIMVLMVSMYFKDTDMTWDILDDGDDCLLILERTQAEGIDSKLTDYFMRLGMKLKVEHKAHTLEDVEWCQAKPILVGGDYKFIRNPAKVLSGALVGPKWMQMRSEDSRRKLANTIGICEAILNRGVPVLQSFAFAIMRNAATTKQIRLDLTDQLIYKVADELGTSGLTRLPAVEPEVITDCARLSFSRAFGIDIQTQLFWEEYLDNWKFSFQEPLEYPSPIHVPTWSWESEDAEVS